MNTSKKKQQHRSTSKKYGSTMNFNRNELPTLNYQTSNLYPPPASIAPRHCSKRMNDHRYNPHHFTSYDNLLLNQDNQCSFKRNNDNRLSLSNYHQKSDEKQSNIKKFLPITKEISKDDINDLNSPASKNNINLKNLETVDIIKVLNKFMFLIFLTFILFFNLFTLWIAPYLIKKSLSIED
jgi:hypothetical protein